ncbi:MAG: 16S rRNA (adenine(1518)-N(6)/adenine(1519)-N(6))-dimethyltransferase RsmA [Candidatus Bathyarchaeia archaeon]
MFREILPYPFQARKRLGQNFLVDRRILEKIIYYADIDCDDVVLEVGSGTGTLTRLLQEKARKVIAVEKDFRLAQVLRERFKNNPKLEIINADILDMDLPYYDKVVATPPYNISSKLLFLLTDRKYQSMTLTFQKEFAERLVAKPGTRDYGRLTVMIKHRANPEILDYISKEAFKPRPKVDSAIVRIIPKPHEQTIDEETFSDLVRGLFTQRRRKLRSALKHYIEMKTGQPLRVTLDIDSIDKRVYQLEVKEFEVLTRRLSPIISGR